MGNYYGSVQYPEKSLRALAAQSGNTTEQGSWIRVDDAEALVVGIRVTAGSGFSLLVSLETTDDETSGGAYPVADLATHTTTGDKDVVRFDGNFKRFVRIVGVESNNQSVTWSARMTKAATPTKA